MDGGTATALLAGNARWDAGADPGGEPLIEAIGLTKRYGDAIAVRDLSFAVGPGEIFGLLGPNGAGKTTTVLMLLGLTEPSAGQARVVGVDPTRDPLAVKRRVGYVPDSVGFYDGLTGRANLAYTARLNRVPRTEAAARVAGLLAQVGLEDVADHRVETYSRGMRQRLGIADALVKDPAVLILDEPTVSLDPEGVAEVLEIIRSIAADRGIAILLSSHLLDQVQAICGRVGIFYAGRLIADGTVAELAARGGQADDVVELAVAGDGDPTGWLAAQDDVHAVGPDPGAPGRLLVHVRRGATAGLAARLVAAGHAPVHLRVREDRLDAIYRRLVHAAADDGAASRDEGGASRDDPPVGPGRRGRIAARKDRWARESGGGNRDPRGGDRDAGGGDR